MFFKKHYRVVGGVPGRRFLIYHGSRHGLKRVGRGFQVIYKGRKILLFGKRPMYQVRFRRRWTNMKRRGNKVFIRAKSKWIALKRARTYYLVYRRQRLLAKKIRQKYQIKYHGKWLIGRRARYGKGRLLRGKVISVKMVKY